MAGLVDPAADMVDVGRCSADGRGQLFLLGVVYLDDIAVNGYLAEIGAHVMGAELRHLVLYEFLFLFGDA